MIYSRANVSTRKTFSQYVSKKYYFMDTFLGRVHKVDMKERSRAFSKLDAV
jgi:hypothetical protein